MRWSPLVSILTVLAVTSIFNEGVFAAPLDVVLTRRAHKDQFSNQAKASIQKGANIHADAVKVTLGPKGRNVAIDKKFGRK